MFKGALLKISGYAFAALCLTLAQSVPAHADWIKGQFTANGKPVVEYHCVPAGKGPYPAVVLLHGAGPRGSGDSAMEDICEDLAEAGYYTEFIEYYSQTEEVVPGQEGKMRESFPVWLGEIHAGIDSMGQNSQIDPKRIGMMGYSLGAFLSMATGATDPGKVDAIVEYYGGLSPALRPMASNLPPTLILHGDADTLVPVAMAHDLDKLMTDANRPHQMHIYPGAHHAFNFRIPTIYNAADAKDAWNRSLDFFAQYLGGKPATNKQASAQAGTPS